MGAYPGLSSGTSLVDGGWHSGLQVGPGQFFESDIQSVEARSAKLASPPSPSAMALPAHSYGELQLSVLPRLHIAGCAKDFFCACHKE